MAQPTDTEILSEGQLALLEPPDGGLTWPSDLWTPAEAIEKLQQAMNEFLRDTCCLLTELELPSVPFTTRHQLPEDYIAMQRVAWRAAAGWTKEIPRGDMFEADQGLVEWESQAQPVPSLWTDMALPTRQLQTMPPANDAGTLHLLYIACGQALTGLGVPITAPEEAVPYIKWRWLGLMLEKLGRAEDAEGAQYCRQRYDEGVAAVKAMLDGWA